MLIVHHVFRPDDSLQTLDVGSLLPAHATALGKVLLAHHPFALAEVAREGLQSFTDATICDPERLERELGGSAERGWAAEIGELHARAGVDRRADHRPARGTTSARWVSSDRRSGCWRHASRAASSSRTSARVPRGFP